MSATHQPVSISDTELHVISSANVKQEFNIFVALPHSYMNSEQAYPVVYMLDGNFMFGIATETVRFFRFSQ
jgi:predicted alpha/beta superfamily hydrolase